MDSLYSDHSYWERQRDTERQKERMKREKTLLTQASSLSSFYKCIRLVFWGPNVTKKPSGPAEAQQCVKPEHSVVLVWPTIPCPELGTAPEAAFHGSAPLPWALWLLYPWEGKLAAQTSSSLISLNSSLPLYHLISKHFTFKHRNFNDPASLLLKKRK